MQQLVNIIYIYSATLYLLQYPTSDDLSYIGRRVSFKKEHHLDRNVKWAYYVNRSANKTVKKSYGKKSC